MIHINNWKGKVSAVLALAMVLPLLTGCAQSQDPTPSNSVSGMETVSGETFMPEASAEAAVVTEPPATIPADGDPDDVTCQGSYSVEDAQAQSAADTVVAVITATKTEKVKNPEAAEESETDETLAEGETEPPEYIEVTTTEEITLTNGQLQVCYWMEVASYQQAGHEISPDFTKPLDTQVCQIDNSVGSWQQYFLREALNTWAAAQALTIWGDLEGIPVEEAYKIREDLHEKHLTDEIPATRLLYGFNQSYQPNALHQAYLDELPALLETLASEYGFSQVDALAGDLAGAGASAEDLNAYAEQLNRGYMFLTELGYDIKVTAEEVEDYFAKHEAEYAAEGITRDSGKYVDMRHILLIPENAEIADDGTVTAAEEDWTRLGWKIKQLKQSIAGTYPYTEGVFATAAANNSQDPGSAMNGGLYENLVKGQLIAELDTWLFDEARASGDTAIITTALGQHLVYFCGSTDIWYAAAEEDLIIQKYQELVTTALEKYPVQIDYSAISLGTAQRSCREVNAGTLLYPDIAHERYPEAPLYLQQDYQGTKYGAYSVVTHGCGITTLAMTATYMSDTQYTVPTLCEMYGRYCTEHGSDRTLFVHTPGDLGFYLKEQVFSAKTAYEALQQGYVVVGLQHEGYWTRGGHYLLFEKLNENGSVVVRDSNIYNYNKLEGHYIDEHDWSTIPGAAVTFWIFYPKYTNCSQCIRCADGAAEAAPAALFNSEYQCGDCDNALLRRNAYLNN